MDLVGYTILIPFIAGAIVRIVPDAFKGLKEGIAFAVSAITFAMTVMLFREGWLESEYFGTTVFRVDTLSSFVLLFVGLFGVLMMLYSLGYMRGKKNLKQYYAYMLFSLGAAYGAVLANDLVVLLAFWGFSGLALYMLINVGGPEATGAAKKTMILVGGTDALMVLGVAIVWVMTGSTSLTQQAIPTITGLAAFAFILFACAAFAKAGAMPFHSWVPDAAQFAPASAVGFLPASVDKLLGIYLLARVSLYLFNLSWGMTLLLLIVGAFTIIAAVMMALVQRDFKRLLGYDAVSQVGYMVLGVGTMNPIGIVGGLFHTVNTAIYKGGLFLGSGAVDKEEGTTDMSKLGGLAKYMPVTFATCVIGALAVSGVPPFNGFVSKWMIYQGIIEMSRNGGYAWVIWLIAAIFGSALTLAIIVKALHSVFLGIREKGGREPREVGATMTIPMIVLAVLCVGFGVFAYAIPLKGFLLPAVDSIPWISVPDVSQWLGWWSPGLATLFIIIGVVIGLIIYLAGRLKGTRTSSMYIGGEILTSDVRVTGTEFYNTVSDMGFFSALYKRAEKRAFDTYDIGRNISFYFIRGFRAMHTGVLPEYLTWMLAGLLVLLFILLR
jgi:formate hydrogenlyase subunit 3/multisubunit Na+/H+ antiporter MnhD subunit